MFFTHLDRSTEGAHRSELVTSCPNPDPICTNRRKGRTPSEMARWAEARRLHLFLEFGFEVADPFLEVGEAA